MTSDEAIIIAAGVGSLPGWGAVAMALYTQRRALPRQTADLKQHIDSSAAPADAGAVLAWGEDHVH